MEPLLTDEQIRRLFADFEEYVKKFKKRTEKIVLAVIVMTLLTLISAAAVLLLSDSRPAASKAAGIIGAVSFIVLFILLNIAVIQNDNYSKKFQHIKPTRNYTKAEKYFHEHMFTQQASYELASAISSEGNIPARFSLNYMLFANKLTMGDLNGAYACLVNDNSLFAQDRFFELKYYNSLMNYYFYLGNSPQCREYAAQAYQGFANAFRAYGKELTFAEAENVLEIMIYDAFCRRDFQRCYDLCRLMTDIYSSPVFNGNEAARIESAMIKLLQAECLYEMNDHRSALIICDEAGHALAGIEYQLHRANELAGKIHNALEAKQ